MKLSAHEQRKVAVEAQCDPRTVASFIGGRSVRGVAAERIREAMAKLGHTGLVPPQPGDVVGVPVPEAKHGVR